MSDERRDRAWVDVIIIASALALAALPFAALELDRREWRRRRSSAAAAVGALKTINASQALFREGDEDDDGALDYGNLDELSNAVLIDGVLGSGTMQGYRFEVRASSTTPEYLWFAVANPIDPYGDRRSFCTNHAGVIFYTSAGLWLEDGGDACAIPSWVFPVGK